MSSSAGTSTAVALARVQVLGSIGLPAWNMHATAGRKQSRAVSPSWASASIAALQATAGNTSPKNPFVSLISLASGRPVSSVRPGYVVTRTGVHLGMTPALTRHMAFVKLTPKHPPGYRTGTAVSVDGVSGQGTMLMDTGINYMFLAAGGNASSAASAHPGT